ncbi:SDR family oxidoreductase, partial [Streptomyces sp. URMC 129]|uniref:SDR family oxidoreductase n=1 Tax=Streptomyces sp. URMC 129 TaxID=3423407 RepID=UPI003F1B09BB
PRRLTAPAAMTLPPASVAITGATGFLGLRLTDQLLRRHSSLLLLTRPGARSATERIARFLESTGTPRSALRHLPARIEEVAIDLARPGLGLGDDAFRRLADRVETLWHCAADTSFAAPANAAHAVNVDGTRHILQLAAAGERAPLLCHVSTVAVAGARRTGTVHEHELDDAHGFQSAYERSKFQAERLVREWVRTHRRPAVVFRPSGLLTRRRAYPGAPPHPLQMAARACRAALRSLPGALRSGDGITLRCGARAGSTNLLPVEHAAYAMAEAVRRGGRPDGLRTYHVVNTRNTPIRTVLEALGEHCGVTIRLTPGRPATAAEQALHRAFGMYLCWLDVERRYDDTGLARLGLACPPHLAVGYDYVVASLRHGLP